MTTVALVVTVLGGLFLSGAAIFVLLAVSELRALWILGSRLPAPVGTRGRVALAGRTEYGVAGPQRAPVSGEDCAWYRVRLVRTPRRFLARDDIGSDPETDFDLLLDVTSPGAPTLTDGGERVPIDLRLLGVGATVWGADQPESRISIVTAVQHRRSAPASLPPIVPASAIDGLRRGERLTLTEWRVPRGVPVFAVGRVTPQGLVPSRTGLTLLTTLSRDEVIAQRRASARTGRWAARWSAGLGLILFLGGVGALKLLG